MGHLLDRVSFAIAPRTRLAVIGPSGAGKTSLLRLINRLSDPTSGQIFYQQTPLNQYSVLDLRRQIGLVMQDSKLLGQTVEDTLCYPARLQGVGAATARRTVQPWLESLKIPSDWLGRQAVDLSMGQRQRVAIARTVATEPSMLLLDEPTSAQDMGYAHYLLNYLASPENTSTVIMVNHQLELVASWATHIIYLEQGRLVSYQPADQVDWTKLKQKIIDTQTDDWDDEFDN